MYYIKRNFSWINYADRTFFLMKTNFCFSRNYNFDHFVVNGAERKPTKKNWPIFIYPSSIDTGKICVNFVLHSKCMSNTVEMHNIQSKKIRTSIFSDNVQNMGMTWIIYEIWLSQWAAACLTCSATYIYI